MRITFLGTGTSTGVPEIGCQCAVCTSPDRYDKRLRSSLLVETADCRLLIDCGPDFREQMLNCAFKPIDGVLLTHEHYDHVGGLDDLRPFARFTGAMEIYAEKRVCDALHVRMPYCFAEPRYAGVPKFNLHTIGMDSFDVMGIQITPIRVMHARLPIVGYRIANVAYLTDLTSIPDSEYHKLTGLDALIIDALRHQPHVSHQTLNEALKQIDRIQPKESYLIHMSHDIGMHSQVQATLPEHVFLSYDNLILDFSSYDGVNKNNS